MAAWSLAWSGSVSGGGSLRPNSIIESCIARLVCSSSIEAWIAIRTRSASHCCRNMSPDAVPLAAAGLCAESEGGAMMSERGWGKGP